MTGKVIEEDVRTIAAGIMPDAAKLSGRTLLITGGAGFLGNYFLLTIDYLNRNVLEKPCKIISADNFITGVGYRIEESENFRAITHDVKYPLQIDEDIDYLIHLAGIASPRFYRKYKIETIDVATLGTKNMLELAKEKKVKSMLFFSSSEVYGDPHPEHVPTNEEYFGNVSCIGPRANYDESKRLGETMCIAYHQTHGVPVKMIRPFNIYGPGMRLDDYRVIPNFVAKAFNSEPIPVYGDGANTRTFCYVSDAMIGFFKVLLAEGMNGEPFNVGSEDNEISMLKLAETMAEIFDNKINIEKTSGPNDAYTLGDPKRRCPDLTKIKKLGYDAKVDLKTGIKRFIQWAIEEYRIQSPLAEAIKPT
ncbi:NAD-dependent epimerase/dehydratase family protein [Candidatus Woesearchaeota archaeon]|nr:NAD-dependent epimerase/dehydratase family protein [Candidatus Woesearchaeota archaeon]